jgi:hypothetical protein
MHVRARLINQREFFYPDSNSPVHLSQFWGILAGYEIRNEPFELNWGTSVIDRDSNEIYSGDVVTVYNITGENMEPLIRKQEIGYVEYLDGGFAITNNEGFIWDLSNIESEKDKFAVSITGNVYTTTIKLETEDE